MDALIFFLYRQKISSSIGLQFVTQLPLIFLVSIILGIIIPRSFIFSKTSNADQGVK